MTKGTVKQRCSLKLFINYWIKKAIVTLLGEPRSSFRGQRLGFDNYQTNDNFSFVIELQTTKMNQYERSTKK
jgi:hypothetical protein